MAILIGLEASETINLIGTDRMAMVRLLATDSKPKQL